MLFTVVGTILNVKLDEGCKADVRLLAVDRPFTLAFLFQRFKFRHQIYIFFELFSQCNTFLKENKNEVKRY